MGPAAATSIYVGGGSPNGSQYAVLQFSAAASGATSPLSTLMTPNRFQINGMANDSTGNTYIVGQLIENSTSEVLVYAAGATGSATPVRTITGSMTGLAYSNCLTVDATGQLYVCSSNNSVLVFSATANGNVAPVRAISGSATLLNNPYRIALDSTGKVYVGNGAPETGRVLIFPAGAVGDVAPTVITGPATALGNAFGIAFDNSDNLYVISHNVNLGGIFGILQFAAGASGNVAPIKTIAGNGTGIFEHSGIAVDALGNIYVVGLDTLPSSLRWRYSRRLPPETLRRPRLFSQRLGIQRG